MNSTINPKLCWLPALLLLASGAAQAVTLNFSALLSEGTCTFNLNKSTLALGDIVLQQLRPATLQAVQPFTLTVSDCRGTEATATPVINVTGDGVLRGGRWLFRSSDSVAADVGIMLVKSDTPPGYGDKEVKHGDDIPLASAGVDPLNQSFTFYAGATCGDTACGGTSAATGTVTARILFSLAYR